MPRCKRGRGGEGVSGSGRFFLRLVANGITAVSTTRRLRVTLIIPEFASRSPVDEVKRLIRRVPERPAMTEVLRVLTTIATYWGKHA